MKTMAERLEESAPYNIFFTTIIDFPETFVQENSITFSDLLCPSLGKLKCSLQLNFIVQIEWLMKQYERMSQGNKPLTILYGHQSSFDKTDAEIKLKYPNVLVRFVKTKDALGIHHSKIGIFVYDDNSLRVVISTANLYSLDWSIYCNGNLSRLWVSPLCPVLPENNPDRAGAGTAYFKPTLLTYLSQYNEPILEDWINYVKRADFSAVKTSRTEWPVQCHLHRVGELLSLHCKLPGAISASTERSARDNKMRSDGKLTAQRKETTIACKSSQRTSTGDEATSTTSEIQATALRGRTANVNYEEIAERNAGDGTTGDETLRWEILAQASSIGYLGNSPKNWLCTTLLRSLASHTRCRLPAKPDATIKIVFPTENDVLSNRYGAEGACCLCYWMDSTIQNQMWPKSYLHSWKADRTNRSKVMPHIKTYCRVSPCMTKLAWFLLTSANISKSAWGLDSDRNGWIYVRSYEAGVLFLPKYFNETYFQIKEDNATTTAKLFPFIYDLPLSPYGAENKPWSHLDESDESDESKE